MTITAIKCKKCNTTVFSRTRHDFRWCECKACAIDGGREYTKVVGNFEDYETILMEIPQTTKELYDDWNTYADKYGVLK